MLGKASVIKTRNQVKDIPVHQERVFSFVAILLFYNTKVRIKSDKQKNVESYWQIGVLGRWLEKMKDRKGNEKANMRILYEIIKVI
jgi:hypothetical protein